MNFLQRLSGVKTHGTALAGVFYIFGAKVFHWFPFDPTVLAGMGFAGLSFLRSGVKASINELMDLASTPAGAQPVAIQQKPSSPFTSGGAALLLAAGLVIAGVALSGCQSPPQRIAYNEASAGQVTLDSLMTAWGDYVAKFHPGTNVEYKVLALYQKARTAELADIDAAHAYANTVGSTNGLVGTVIDAYHSPEGQAALSELSDFLRNLGVFNFLKGNAPAFSPLPAPPGP